MKDLFNFTYDFLMFLSKTTGFNYKEVNIIIWFFIIPLSWAFMMDIIRGKHHFKIGYVVLTAVALLMIKDVSKFSIQLFDISARFLRSFDRVGSNYVTSSLVICLFIPLTIYALLFRKLIVKKRSHT